MEATAPLRTPRLEIVDAMRAFAVIAVVLFHVFPASLTGGFIGVDVFFAISGFVITLRYLEDLAAGKSSFATFFARRVRRLVPAYFLLLLVVALFAVVVMAPKDLENFGQSLAAQAIYLQNVAFWGQGNYFDDPLLKPLLHTWSLAVEEQFYLFFPLLILLFRWRRDAGIAAVVLLTAGSFILGMIAKHITEVGTFYLLPFRVWEFTVGILCAIGYRRIAQAPLAPSIATTATLAGLAAMVIAVVAFDEKSVFPNGQAVLALAGTCVIFLVQDQVSPWLRRAAAYGVVQHFGRISYSWYLWHWPIISLLFLLNDRPMTNGEALAALVLGYLAAVASYRFVEQPFQHAQAFRPRRRTLGLLAAFTGFALVVGSTMALTQGLISRYSGRERLLYAAQMDRPPYRCQLWARLASYDSDFCQINQGGSGPGVLLIGDSHADLMKPALAKMATTAARPLFLNKQDCRVIDYGRDSNCPANAWPRLLQQVRDGRFGDVIVISRYTKDSDTGHLRRAIEDLVATGARVTIEPTTPENAAFDPETYIHAGQADRWPEAISYSRARYLSDNGPMLETMRQLARERGVTLIEPLPLLCPDRCLFAKAGVPLFHDMHHLTSQGAAIVAPLYTPVIGTQPLVPQARADPINIRPHH